MSGCTPAMSPDTGSVNEFITISPLTRTGGHYKLSVAVQGGAVSEAQLDSGSWQGLEMIMTGRDPREAVQIMQRWEASCPVSQAVAAATAVEMACRAAVPGGAVTLRNLMQAAAFVAAHLTHFYQRALPDYVQGQDSAPYAPRYGHSDLRMGPDDSDALAGEALASLEHVRLCHEIITLLGGGSPQPTGIICGGVYPAPTRAAVLSLTQRLRTLQTFVESGYLRQVYKLAAAYKGDLFSFGQGYRGAICVGALPLEGNQGEQVFRRGVYSGGKDTVMDARQIKTFLRYARFDTTGTGLGFRESESGPQADKKDAYSFIKAARYQGVPLETGPLARMWISNPPLSAVGRGEARRHFGLNVQNFRDFGESVVFSPMGRHIARAEECFYLLSFMDGWLRQITPGTAGRNAPLVPEKGEGIGLTEAPQGALIHYLSVKDKAVAKYQVIAPEMWNASPKDDLGQRGVIEQALIGVPVPDFKNPVHLGRVVRAFGL